MLAKLEEQKCAYENKLHDLNENWLNKLNSSLQELRTKLNRDSDKALQLNSQQLIHEKGLELEQFKYEHDKEVDTLKSDIEIKQNTINEMSTKYRVLDYENDQLKAIIRELRDELKCCIDYFATIKNDSLAIERSKFFIRNLKFD